MARPMCTRPSYFEFVHSALQIRTMAPISGLSWHGHALVSHAPLVPAEMSLRGHDGHIAYSDESRLEHAGYQCLGCRQAFSTVLALGQHTESPYMRGTRCGVLSSAAELRNVPRAHMATGQAQSVPMYRPGAL